MSSATKATVRQFRGRMARTILLISGPLSLIVLSLIGGLAYLYGRGLLSLQYSLILLALIILLAGATWWLVVIRAFRSLPILVEEAQNFAQGNWDQRSQISRQDEIGMLAHSFNLMADDVTELNRRLEIRTSEYESRTQTLAQLSWMVTTSSLESTQSLEELLYQTLALAVKRFGYTFAAVYLVEPPGEDGHRYAALCQGAVSSERSSFERNLAEKRLSQRVSLEASDQGQGSLVAQAIMTNRPQTGSISQQADAEGFITSVMEETPLESIPTAPGSSADASLSPDLVEAAIPISLKEQTLGVLNVIMVRRSPRSQTSQAGLLPSVIMAELQILANHIAFVLAPVSQLEPGSPEVKVGLLRQPMIEKAAAEALTPSLLSYFSQASHQITQAETPDQILATARYVLQQAPYATMLLLSEGDTLRVVHRWPEKILAEAAITYKASEFHRSQEAPESPAHSLGSRRYYPSLINLPADGHPPSNLGGAGETACLPQALLDLFHQMGCQTVAFLPTARGKELAALLLVGATTPLPDLAILQPFIDLVELVAAALSRVRAQQVTHRRLAELQTLWNISQTISIETDLNPLYRIIHDQVMKVMGEVSSFAIALYDAETQLIRFPYMVEEGNFVPVPPFPLGEGLTSIVLRSGHPLLLDTEKEAQVLGARYVGVPAKSWLGVPLLHGGETFGAIIIQDIHREQRFDEEDQRLLGTIAAQVAVVIRNARYLEASRRAAELEKLVYDITDKIRRSPDIRTILKTTADELGTALKARRALIQLQVDEGPSVERPQDGRSHPADIQPANVKPMEVQPAKLHPVDLPAEGLHPEESLPTEAEP